MSSKNDKIFLLLTPVNLSDKEKNFPVNQDNTFCSRNVSWNIGPPQIAAETQCSFPLSFISTHFPPPEYLRKPNSFWNITTVIYYVFFLIIKDDTIFRKEAWMLASNKHLLKFLFNHFAKTYLKQLVIRASSN